MIKCLVKHCQNHIHEGMGRTIHEAHTDGVGTVRSHFICEPCWLFLTRGVEDGQVNFDNMVFRLIGPERFEENRRRWREVELDGTRIQETARKLMELAYSLGRTSS